MSKRILLCLAIVAVLAPVQAQETLNTDINAKVRQEEASHSQIMRTLHFLADVAPAVVAAATASNAATAARARIRVEVPTFGMVSSPPLGFAAKVRRSRERVGYGAVARW